MEQTNLLSEDLETFTMKKVLILTQGCFCIIFGAILYLLYHFYRQGKIEKDLFVYLSNNFFFFCIGHIFIISLLCVLAVLNPIWKKKKITLWLILELSLSLGIVSGFVLSTFGYIPIIGTESGFFP